MAEEEIYEVIVTIPARDRFQGEILDYVEQNFSISRTMEVEAGLLRMVRSLALNPHRAALEKSSNSNKAYRFVLFRETVHFEIKILFFIHELTHKVYVVDFFPTRMSPSKMKLK